MYALLTSEIYGIYPYNIQTVAKHLILPVSRCNKHRNDGYRCHYNVVKFGDNQNITYIINFRKHFVVRLYFCSVLTYVSVVGFPDSCDEMSEIVCGIVILLLV
jgi:hypothetical protein